MPNQARAPYVRLFYGEQEFSANIDEFRYTDNESSSDICHLTVTFDSLLGYSMDMFNDKTEFNVVWGYVGEKETRSKKIYLQQKIFTYGKQISVDLILTDKAFDLIATSSRAVYNKSSIIDVGKSIAKKHDLTFKVELPAGDDGSRTLVLSEIENLNKKKQEPVNKNLPIFNPNDPQWKNLNSPNSTFGAPMADYNRRYAERVQAAIEGRTIAPSGYVDVGKALEQNFVTHDSIPQANRSDRQILNEIGLDDPEGQSIAYTTGDELIIRKRNFKKKPYRTYEYRGDNGDVLTFSPEYRGYDKSGPSNSMGYVGWDRFSKEFYSGSANGFNSSVEEAINNFQTELNFLRTLDPNADLGTFVIRNQQLFYNPNKKQVFFTRPPGINYGREVPFQNRADNTIVLMRNEKHQSVSVRTGIELLERTIDEAYKQSKTLTDPSINNPVDAFNQASNHNVNSNLKKNPAVLEVEGDVNLEVGMILTMMGVHDEHKGNYYVIEAEHVINRSGYLCRLTLVRDGTTLKAKKSVDVRGFGRRPNNLVGDYSFKKTKKLVGGRTK